MIGPEPHGLHRFGSRQPEVDLIEQGLQGRLVLAIASRHADSQHGFPLLEHQRWRERNPRPFSGHNAIGMSFPSVEALQPRSQPDAGFPAWTPLHPLGVATTTLPQRSAV